MLDPHKNRVTFPLGMAGKLTPAPIRKALAEFVAIRDRHREEDRAAVVLARDIELAETEETKAAADALRAGRAMPASKLEHLRGELAERERQVAALRQATSDAFTALVAAVDEHGDAWRAALDNAVKEQRAALVAAVEQVATADRELAATLSTRTWVDGFPERDRVKPAKVGEPSLTRPSGDPYGADELVEGLRAYAAGFPAQLGDGGRFAPGVNQVAFGEAQKAREAAREAA